MSTPTLEVNSWLEGASGANDFSAIDADQDVDWLIVGAGFTGVAAAYRIAELCPGDRVILLDATTPGQGSSSRSSGFAVSLGHFDGPKIETENLYRLGKVGLEILRRTVDSLGIQCDWNESGRLIGARGQAGLKSLSMVRTVLDSLQSPFDDLDSEEIETLTGMQGYVGGIRQRESVLVNPAKLLQGLVKNLPDQIRVFGQSRVQDLRFDSRWIASSNGLTIRARRVLVTTNGLLRELGFGRNRLFPMRTFVSVFRPEIESDANTCGRSLLGNEDQWGITSVERVGSSLRLVRNRIFLRNWASVGADAPREETLRKIASIQSDSIQRRFPTMTMNLENTWSGVIGVSANGTQVYGEKAPGLFLSCGYNGHGICQGTISGQNLVDLALGRSNEMTEAMKGLRSPIWIPEGRPLKFGVDVFLAYLNWRFSREL